VKIEIGPAAETEHCLTRSITIIALTCFLVVGAAATSILTRESMQATDAETPAMVVKNPVANREAKHDRLAVASLALASLEPQQSQGLIEPLRQAYASSSPADVEAAKAVAALPEVAPPPSAPARPKAAAANKPQPQKSYALLSDGQIAGIKERLKLSSSQESYWPPVETALRAVARKLHAQRQPVRMRAARLRSIRTPTKFSSSNRRRCRFCSSSARIRRKRCASSRASSGWTRSPRRSDVRGAHRPQAEPH
jgi:hypothetical protein